MRIRHRNCYSCALLDITQWRIVYFWSQVAICALLQGGAKWKAGTALYFRNAAAGEVRFERFWSQVAIVALLRWGGPDGCWRLAFPGERLP